MNTNVIAIVARSQSLGEAIKAHLSTRNPNARLVIVQKIGDAPANAEIASRGMPQFIPGTTAVKLYNVGVRMLDRDATPAQRKAQWDKISAPNATVEDILPELGWVEEMFVLPAKAYADAKTQVTEHRLNISEAGTDAELLAAYKDGFNSLRDIFLSKAATTVEEAPLDEDEAPL